MTIERNGMTIELTNAEMERAFRIVEHNYHIMDARYTLEETIERGYDFENEQDFKNKMGFSLSEACDEKSEHYLLDYLATDFEDKIDNETDNNSIWNYIMENLVDNYSVLV